MVVFIHFGRENVSFTCNI